MAEGQEEDGEKEALRDEIKQLAERVSELESALRSVTQPLGRLRDQIDSMGSIASNYFKLLELYQRKGEISPEAVLPELKDPISIEIVKVLFDQGGLNVSEVTDRLRERRGSASRTIVRERLTSLVEEGIVTVEEERGDVRRYSISQDVTDRWFRLLGLRR